jgi:hypothetical protein
MKKIASLLILVIAAAISGACGDSTSTYQAQAAKPALTQFGIKDVITDEPENQKNVRSSLLGALAAQGIVVTSDPSAQPVNCSVSAGGSGYGNWLRASCTLISDQATLGRMAERRLTASRRHDEMVGLMARDIAEAFRRQLDSQAEYKKPAVPVK